MRTESESRAWRVLYIEDTDEVRRVVARMIEHLGHEVIAADSGEEGLKSLHGADLVVTDVGMQHMNGLDVLRSVRRERPDLPVVFLSALVEARTLEGDEAPDLVLSKPASLSDLRQAFRSLESPADADAGARSVASEVKTRGC